MNTKAQKHALDTCSEGRMKRQTPEIIQVLGQNKFRTRSSSQKNEKIDEKKEERHI